MKLREITGSVNETWNAFVLQNAPEVFLQSAEWGEFQKAVGHHPHYFIFSSAGGEIKAQALVLEHHLPLGAKYWYVPRGPIFAGSSDAADEQVAKAFFLQLKRAAQTDGAMFLRWDAGRGSSFFQKNLTPMAQQLAFSVQPSDTLLLDLSHTEEELLAEMKSKTRYNIRLSAKKQVQVQAVETKRENLDIFWRLTETTADRASIKAHAKNHYAQMLQSLQEESKAKLFARLYFARWQDEVLAANLVLFFGDTVTYLHGASSDKHRAVMAPYALQWRQILDAKSWGARHYDFWGINFQNKKPEWAGFTRFKEGFGGKVVSYAPVYDLPLRRAVYAIYTRIKKLR